jgi:hypothetical protein
MIQKLIARWRQRRLVKRGLALTGVVAPNKSQAGCCGGQGGDRCKCGGGKK